ncbi:hypothetical protein CLSAP_11640 [Clostridium saccharoperbutylacetonicum]|nr:hypothetical protein CLSAP_11640 [Clostridium saccharoperbutylacetonicum]NSB29557.1 hypothetical protein [Clostridium saccharoperbutylacetonicum]
MIIYGMMLLLWKEEAQEYELISKQSSYKIILILKT